MKKSILLFLVVSITCCLPMPIFAESSRTNIPVPIESVSPATQTTVNGIPDMDINPRAITLGPFFKSYSGQNSTINYFKKIGSTYVDNRNNSTPFILTYNVSRSEEQGSEFSCSLTLSGEMKLSVVANVGASVTGGCTLTKKTNEAVGVSGTMTVPVGKQGRLEAWYGGISTNGTIYYYYDVDGVIKNGSKPLSAKIHNQQLVVNFKPVTY